MYESKHPQLVQYNQEQQLISDMVESAKGLLAEDP
jgi:methyl coenzyme M reductase gamma subunit